MTRVTGLDSLTPGQLVIARRMLESELRDTYIVPAARTLGYEIYFTWDSRHSPDGYPDLTLCRKTIFWAELKREGEELTEAQWRWNRAIKATGHEAYIWTPSSWLSGEIIKFLEKEG